MQSNDCLPLDEVSSRYLLGPSHKVCYKAKNGSLKGSMNEGAASDRPCGVIRKKGNNDWQMMVALGLMLYTEGVGPPRV